MSFEEHLKKEALGDERMKGCLKVAFRIPKFKGSD